MNQQHNPSTNFEDRLLAQLRAVVAQRGAAEAAETAEAPAPTPARRRGPRLALGGAVALVAVAAALIVSVGGEGTSAAYAVEPQPNGDVSVQINDLSDASGIEAALKQAGIPADVTYLPAGMTCRRSGLEAFPGDSMLTGHVDADGVSDGSLTFKVDPHVLGPGQTLVLTATAGSKETTISGASLQVQIATGKVAPCNPVQA